MKRFSTLLLVGLILALTACRSTELETTESVLSNISETAGSSEPTATMRTPLVWEPVIEDLIIDISDPTNQRLTGRITDRVIIDAELLCSVDPNHPGKASVYSGGESWASKSQRNMFTGDDWTLTESEEYPQYFDSQLIGTAYRDRYVDSSGQEYLCQTGPSYSPYSRVYTLRGRMTYSLGQSLSPEYYASTDFAFADEKTAHESAKSFLESAGISINECYRVRRLSHEELDAELRVYNHSIEAAERFDADVILPGGWTEEEDAYWFTFFWDIGRIPVVNKDFSGYLFLEGEFAERFGEEIPINGREINVIINAHGVDYVDLTGRFSSPAEMSSGDLMSLDELLVLFSEELYAISREHSFEDIKKSGIGEIVTLDCPEPITVNEVSLVYITLFERFTIEELKLRSFSEGESMFRPYWVIRCSQSQPDEGNPDRSASTLMFFDAITGECVKHSIFGGEL